MIDILYSMKKYLKILVAPLVILAVVFLLSQVWKLLNLPSDTVLIPMIKNYFEHYGVWLVFVSAIIESGFVVGIYAPGGLVIFLGVIFSVGNPVQAMLVVLSVIVGFLVGFSIDYVLGKYGWYRFLLHFGMEKALLKTKQKVQKYGMSTALVGYHDPNLGSLIATTYGILQYSYEKFLVITLPAITLWCVIWGTLAYILGEKALEILGYKALFIILGIWIVARIIEERFTEKALDSE